MDYFSEGQTMTPINLGTIGVCDKTMRQTLLDLLKTRYVTPLDALTEAGCLSLSQRCGEFRKAGIKVLDKWVDLDNGKRVKAYTVVG